MTDLELIKLIKENQRPTDINLLFFRYQKLIHKIWNSLHKILPEYYAFNIKDDFYSDSYVEFRKALDAINLEKVYTDDWKFVTYFGFYLKNLRKKYYKAYKKELITVKPIISVNRSSGDEYVLTDNIDQTSIVDINKYSIDSLLESFSYERLVAACSYCYKHIWTDLEKQIFLLRSQGFKYFEIKDKLNVCNNTIKTHMKKMKESVEQKINEKIE